MLADDVGKLELLKISFSSFWIVSCVSGGSSGSGGVGVSVRFMQLLLLLLWVVVVLVDDLME